MNKLPLLKPHYIICKTVEELRQVELLYIIGRHYKWAQPGNNVYQCDVLGRRIDPDFEGKLREYPVVQVSPDRRTLSRRASTYAEDEFREVFYASEIKWPTDIRTQSARETLGIYY